MAANMRPERPNNPNRPGSPDSPKSPKKSKSSFGSKLSQNKTYLIVVGAALVLILILVIILVTRVNQNRPEPTESMPPTEEFTESETTSDNGIETTETFDSQTTPATTVSSETTVVTQTTAETEGGATISNLPAQTTQPTAVPPENIIDPIKLPEDFFGYIDTESAPFINDTATNASYEGDYSGVIWYDQENLDKLTLSGNTKARVDHIIALSHENVQDLYGSLAGGKLSLESESYPLSNSGKFSVDKLSPVGGVTEYKNVTPVINGGTASLRVYYLAEGMISYVYSESYQADLTRPDTLAWFEIRGELYPE